MQNVFTKAADIFSLGITVLELASKLELPKNGYLWRKLRDGNLPANFLPRKPWVSMNLIYTSIHNVHPQYLFDYIFKYPDLSIDLQNVIKLMMHPRWEQRPDVDTLLAVPQIKKILRRRRLIKPFIKIVR